MNYLLASFNSLMNFPQETLLIFSILSIKPYGHVQLGQFINTGNC